MKTSNTIRFAIASNLFALIVCAIACTEDKKSTIGEYQVNLEMDHIVVMDNGRHVATLPYREIGNLENVFIIDNE